VPGCSANALWGYIVFATEGYHFPGCPASHTHFSDAIWSSWILYRSNASGRYNVGQSASLAFYKYEAGKQAYSDPSTLSRLTRFRGPFNRATDWLSQDLRIKGSLLNQTPSPEMGHARNNIDAAIDLCSCYPGEHPVIQNIRTPNKPSTFLFDDNSLSQC